MRERARSRIVGVALAASISAASAIAGCSSESAGVNEQPSGPVVEVAGMAFSPARLTVRVGETVTWNFDDRGVTHDVAGIGEAKGVLRSPLMQTGSFTYNFTEPGTYEYTCSLHPDMRGTIVVT
jgi:plastocyanin